MSEEKSPPADSPTLPISQEASSVIKNRYRLERELGRGGMGVVFLARDQELHDRPVVIKVLRDIAPGEWHTKKFRQEIEALVRIEHPGVVGVFDAGEMPNGQLFVVMQFVDGVNLRSQMAEGPMEFERVARIVEQIGSALNAAHEKGILHCDLKPENVMVQKLQRGQQNVKLIDFGIAKIRDSQFASQSTKIAGTIEYMAPEQMNGSPCVASDIFSLAVIAYEMLTAQKPFPSQNLIQLIEMHRSGVRTNMKDLRSDIPSGAQTVILKALQYDPAARYQNAIDFTDDLARALRSDPSIPAPGATAIIKPKRNFLLPAISLLALISIVIIASTIFLRPHPQEPPVASKGVAPASSAPPSAPLQELKYSIRLQKGQDSTLLALKNGMIFKGGQRFQVLLSSTQAGHLYVLNEGPFTTEGVPDYVILFPGSNTSSRIVENKEITIPEKNHWLRLDLERGTEKIWFIYAKDAVSEFENLKRSAKGEINEKAEAMMLSNLFTEHRPKVEATYDSVKQEMNIKASGKLLVYELMLEHE